MLGAMLEHAGSICPSDAQKCYERTQRTNATDARIQDQGSDPSVLNAPGAVDNHVSATRVIVACINWGHDDAPKAVSYALRDGEMLAHLYHRTWDEAIVRANTLAHHLRVVAS